MGIFNRGDNGSKSSSETTIIASGSKIEGTLKFNCKLHIDGEVEGLIESNNVVTIGKKGYAKGRVEALRFIVSGIFEGDAICETIEMLDGGRFLGKSIAKILVVEAGAHFEGESIMKKDGNEELKS